LGLSEATGITHVRGTVIRLISPEGTPAPEPNVASDAAKWERSVAALPAEEQVKAVAARLKELNQGFDGTVTHSIDGNGVTELQFSADHVTNIAPVRALSNLRVLNCSGSRWNQGRLADLLPLKGMRLTNLNCSETEVSELSPLKGMPLTRLLFAGTMVSDLAPLKGMPLTYMDCTRTQVSNLALLKGMRLRSLMAEILPVSDLSPLQGMPLTQLGLFKTQVTDLSLLRGMPLTYLNLAYTPVSDLSPLKDMKTLQRLHLNDMPVTDLSMLKGLPLHHLDIRSTRVSDLAPLKGLPLKQLGLDYRPERDAEVLRSLTGLEEINEMPAAGFWKAHAK
jgi:Leucine-rich repeat (LRR) protein